MKGVSTTEKDILSDKTEYDEIVQTFTFQQQRKFFIKHCVRKGFGLKPDNVDQRKLNVARKLFHVTSNIVGKQKRYNDKLRRIGADVICKKQFNDRDSILTLVPKPIVQQFVYMWIALNWMCVLTDQDEVHLKLSEKLFSSVE